MTTQTTNQTNGEATQGNENVPAKAEQQQNRMLTTDDSQFANLLDTAKFNHMWRVATLFAASKMVPQHYQGSPEDCFIGIQMAVRLGVDPFMYLQNTYIVQGKPGMEAKLAIALINSSGLFTDSLDYEVEGGPDPFADDYRVRAFATRKSTGKVVYGPWIDWNLVKKDGWDSKGGSKWKTMPGPMFQYRAATFFGRLHCPERLMGMQTVDEVNDVVGVRQVDNAAGQLPGEGRTRFGFGHRKPFDPEQVNTETGEVNQSEHPREGGDGEPQTPPVAEGQIDQEAHAENNSTAGGEPAGDDAAAEGAGGGDGDDGEPGPADKLVMLLAETCGCSDADALTTLEEHAGMSLGKLSKKSLDAMTKKIKSGEIAV